MTTPTTYPLGAVQSHVQAAANELGSMFSIARIGGYGPGSVPGSDHPKGLALDFMTSVRATGDALVDYLIANADRYGVKYIIWQRHQWQGGQWSAYTGKNPHTDHVHVSFNDRGPSIVGAAGQLLKLPFTAPANVTEAIGNLSAGVGSIAESALSVGRVADLVTRAFLPTAIIRGVALVLGVVFLLIGIWFIAREAKDST